MTSAPFLREVPLLQGSPAAVLERQAAGARFVDVHAGAWLLREGEERGAMRAALDRLEADADGVAYGILE